MSDAYSEMEWVVFAAGCVKGASKGEERLRSLYCLTENLHVLLFASTKQYRGVQVRQTSVPKNISMLP